MPIAIANLFMPFDRATGYTKRSVSALCQGTQEERQVRGSFGEPTDEVAVPLRAERNLDPDVVTRVGQPPLLGVADAVEHLVLEIVHAPVVLADHRGHCFNDLGIV